jgi:hypothetical protein
LVALVAEGRDAVELTAAGSVEIVVLTAEVMVEPPEVTVESIVEDEVEDEVEVVEDAALEVVGV